MYIIGQKVIWLMDDNSRFAEGTITMVDDVDYPRQRIWVNKDHHLASWIKGTSCLLDTPEARELMKQIIAFEARMLKERRNLRDDFAALQAKLVREAKA
jgi:hypothetical protein